MIFRTKNSVYRVEESEPGVFLVTKVEEIQPSHYNAIGQTRVSHEARIVVGEVAQFDTWHTSKVVSIEPGGRVGGGR